MPGKKSELNHVLHYQTSENFRGRKDLDRNVLNAYLESFPLWESENVNERTLLIVELVTCQFCRMASLN